VAELLPLVLVGHLLGDWIVQTDAQAEWKAVSWAAMGRHMLGYHLTLGIAAGVVLGPSVELLVLLVVSTVTHGFIDRRWPVVRLLRATGSPWFAEQPWGVLCADQALHLSILCVLVAVIG